MKKTILLGLLCLMASAAMAQDINKIVIPKKPAPAKTQPATPKPANTQKETTKPAKTKAEQVYVDLGLPSGTKWKTENIPGYYTYDEAQAKYGNQLPSTKQWEELMYYCQWTWTGNGFKVHAPNGNSIILPSTSYREEDGSMGHDKTRGYYRATDFWYLVFDKEGPALSGSYDMGFTIRPVQNATVQDTYVDLGLPSGTKWKKTNEAAFYYYDEAVSEFGKRLPTEKQWEELKSHCKWSWNGSGYTIVGPNGNSIILPAAGSIDDNSIDFVGEDGDYWSSTAYSPETSTKISFSSSHIDIYACGTNFNLSVRLVQN